MPSTRRTLLAVAVPTVLTPLAGCTGDVSGPSDAGTTTEPTTTESTTAESTMTVRLLGPDAERTLFTETDVVAVGEVRERTGSVAVPITITEERTETVSETFASAGVAEDPDAFEVAIRVDGDRRNRYGIAPGLAEAIESGDWEGELHVSVADRSTAEELQRALACVADSAPVDCG